MPHEEEESLNVSRDFQSVASVPQRRRCPFGEPRRPPSISPVTFLCVAVQCQFQTPLTCLSCRGGCFQHLFVQQIFGSLPSPLPVLATSDYRFAELRMEDAHEKAGQLCEALAEEQVYCKGGSRGGVAEGKKEGKRKRMRRGRGKREGKA